MNLRRRSGWQAFVRAALPVAMLMNGFDAAGADLDVGTDVYVGAMSRWHRDAGHTSGFDTYYVTAELNVYPFGKPYHAGLFVDYRDSSSARLTDNVNIGGYVRYDFSRWDSTAWLFSNRSPDSSGTWVYAARLRYRLKDDHKLGIEALAPLENAGEPVVMGGYYGSVSKALSVRVLAGAGINHGPDFAGRFELLWQVR